MMRGGTLLILGHGVKGQGQPSHFTLWTRNKVFCACFTYLVKPLPVQKSIGLLIRPFNYSENTRNTS